MSEDRDSDGHIGAKMWWRQRQVREKVCCVVGGRSWKIMTRSSVGRERREVVILNYYR